MKRLYFRLGCVTQMLFTFTVSERERQREETVLLPRSLRRRRRYDGIIKHFLLRSNELRAAAPAALGCEGQGGHYKELTIGKFDVVSASFVCTNARNSAKRSRGLFPLTQNKHNAVLSSQSSKSESAARCCFFSFSLQPIAFEPHRCPPSPPTPALSGCGGRPVSLRPRFPSTVAIASAAVPIRLARGQEVKLHPHPYYSDVRWIRLPMNKVE